MDINHLIAHFLLGFCEFKHDNGTPYMDDALDTWACLFSQISLWENVERALIEINGEEYYSDPPYSPLDSIGVQWDDSSCCLTGFGKVRWLFRGGPIQSSDVLV